MSHLKTGNPEWDRGQEIRALRAKILIASLRSAASYFDRPIETAAPSTEELDNAVKALAAKLNEPEKCYACGQECKR